MTEAENSEHELEALTLRVVQIAFHNNRSPWQCWRFLLNQGARAEMNNRVVTSTWTREVLASPANGKEARDVLGEQIKTTLKWRGLLLAALGAGALLWSHFEPTLWHHTKWGFLISALSLVLTFVINHSIDLRLVRQWDEAWKSFQVSETPVSMQGAEFLLWLFLPREGREAAIGDTKEKFGMMIERFGVCRARFWLWCEVARSAWPILSYLGERLFKIGVLDAVFRFLRR